MFSFCPSCQLQQGVPEQSEDEEGEAAGAGDPGSQAPGVAVVGVAAVHAHPGCPRSVAPRPLAEGPERAGLHDATCLSSNDCTGICMAWALLTSLSVAVIITRTYTGVTLQCFTFEDQKGADKNQAEDCPHHGDPRDAPLGKESSLFAIRALMLLLHP